MSKFNTSTQNVNKTVNKSGVVAFKMDEKEKLVTQVLTTFFGENKFYGNNDNEIINTIQSILEYDPKFIANLALFARNEFHLRSISHVLTAELAKSIQGKPFARKTIGKVVERVDDMSEILSYYINKYNKPIPNSMKKGLADSFLRFNEYSLQKYNGKNKAVKLRDILCLVHPKPKTNEQSDMFKRLLEDRLKTPVTWETELSAKGNTKEVWEQLINDNKLGYMAMIRNLRNIIKSGASNIDKVYEFLGDEEKVLKNKLLPFRYYSAYKALTSEGLVSSKVIDTLEKAIKISTRNINKLQGKTLLSADVSGSMNSGISAKSDVLCSDIATLMMSMANYICEDTFTTAFDTKLYQCNLASSNGIISNAKSINVNGGGTDITLPIKWALDNKMFVDRIIIFSDNEINSGWVQTNSFWRNSRSVQCQALVDRYRQEVNPDVWVHAIDLQGYGTQQFMGKNVNIISGWSEKTLEYIDLVEKGSNSLIQEIEGYYFK